MRALGLALMLLALPAYAQVYKCVDGRDVTHYSDKPRPDCRSEQVDIQPIPPVWGKITPYNEDLRAAELDFQRRQIERRRQEEAATRWLENQARQCASLRSELQRFTSLRRIATVDAKGERTFMDAEARDAKVARLNSAIAQRCR